MPRRSSGTVLITKSGCRAASPLGTHLELQIEKDRAVVEPAGRVVEILPEVGADGPPEPGHVVRQARLRRDSRGVLRELSCARLVPWVGHPVSDIVTIRSARSLVAATVLALRSSEPSVRSHACSLLLP